MFGRKLDTESFSTHRPTIGPTRPDSDYILLREMRITWCRMVYKGICRMLQREGDRLVDPEVVVCCSKVNVGCMGKSLDACCKCACLIYFLETDQQRCKSDCVGCEKKSGDFPHVVACHGDCECEDGNGSAVNNVNYEKEDDFPLPMRSRHQKSCCLGAALCLPRGSTVVCDAKSGSGKTICYQCKLRP